MPVPRPRQKGAANTVREVKEFTRAVLLPFASAAVVAGGGQL